MLLEDLLYCANNYLVIWPNDALLIFLNHEDFKNIVNKLVILNHNNEIIINSNIKIYYSPRFLKINKKHAIFEFENTNLKTIEIEILTENERIIKNILE